MSLSSNTLPLAVDEISTDENLANRVGELFEKDGKIYRLVKVTSAITSPEKTFLAYADVEAYTVDAKAAGEKRHNVAGLIDSGITAALADGDYILVLVDGIGTAIAGTASLAADVALLTFTGGKVDDATPAFDNTVAYSAAAQASADGDVNVRVQLL